MKRILEIKRTTLAGLLALTLPLAAPSPALAADLSLSNIPLYLDLRVDPNVLFNLSVERPMGGAAYNDQPGTPAACTGRLNNVGGDGSADNIGTCYFNNVEYIGYFDPRKCYDVDSSNKRFKPSGKTNANYECGGKWSGNFLNWATMTAIDEFIYTMTGGNRVIDNTSNTVVRRARKEHQDNWYPIKAVGSSVNVSTSTVTPYSNSLLFIYNTDFGVQLGTSYSNARGSSPTYGPFDVALVVCDPNQGVEPNCVSYGNGGYFKPEGLVQRNADTKRFAVTSYTFDSDNSRHGGVLRSNMKYVGPTRPKAGGGTEANPNKEWGTNGLLVNNPDGASGGLNSGVINYLNKFSDPGYKSRDPVSELFYETLRYFKNQGPTPEYAAGLPAGGEGGFQIVSNWQDPYQYTCQQSFIIGINDANPWFDKRLPGTAFQSQTITYFDGTPWDLDKNANGVNSDWGEPSNADSTINVKSLTDKVGQLEDAAGGFNLGKFRVGGGDGNFDEDCTDKDIRSLGLGGVMGTCAANSTGRARRDNSYYVAGLAYYANTTDVRPDLAGDQKISTFMIDTQEFSTTPNVGPTNPLWLVGKYGGFIDENGNNEPDQVTEWDKDGDGEPDNYVLATEPQKLIDGLNKAFIDVDNRTSSGAAVALNAGSLGANTRLYQARYNSGTWTGQLLSYALDQNTGALVTPEVWEAGALLTTATTGNGWSTKREIITYDGSQGTPFRWASLPSSMQDELNKNGQGAKDVLGAEQGAQRLEYLRGSSQHEAKGNNYRVRASKLGDIVFSAPAFVGPPTFAYPDGLESSGEKYSTFKANNTGRTPVVYVGANDGMLHAFDAATGIELMAYVPKSVFPRLTRLTDSNYKHTFYVDGPPTVGDAFNGSTWRTMLVSGLRQGGQGLFALDVTSPASFAEASAASLVKWEFTDKDDSDLGYTFSRPSIARMKNGKWAVIVGNGYNNTETDGAASTTGNAVLYILDLFTGQQIAKIDTGVGRSQDPSGNNKPNGLATVSPVDVDGNHVIDYIYGGDLFGNLWKFDVTNASAGSWGIAYGGSPLFVATDAAGVRHAITTRPEVGLHPQFKSGSVKFNNGGLMIYFGTGKYLEIQDNAVTGTQTQAFYGIWDPDRATKPSYNRTSNPKNLLQQQILEENTVTVNSVSADIRITSDNAIAWASDPLNPSSGEHIGWYMDLVNTEAGNTDPFGEKQVTNSTLRDGRIIFTTELPSSTPCEFGGSGWLMELDAADGSRLENAPFDVDGDGVFDLVTDANGNLVAPGGMGTTGGASSAPGIVDKGDGTEYKYLTGVARGDTQKIDEQASAAGATNSAREAWQQLR